MFHQDCFRIRLSRLTACLRVNAGRRALLSAARSSQRAAVDSGFLAGTALSRRRGIAAHAGELARGQGAPAVLELGPGVRSRTRYSALARERSRRTASAAPSAAESVGRRIARGEIAPVRSLAYRRRRPPGLDSADAAPRGYRHNSHSR